MPRFSTYCNEGLGAKGSSGIQVIDHMIHREGKELIMDEIVVEVDSLVNMAMAQLGIQEEAQEELVRARVKVVLARLLEKMPARARMFVDEEIPPYLEAMEQFNELDN